MPGIIDQITTRDEDGKSIGGHMLSNVMVLVLAGSITPANGVAYLEAMSGVTLDNTTKTQLNEMKSHFDGLGANDRVRFLVTVDAAVQLLINPNVGWTGADFKSAMGITT